MENVRTFDLLSENVYWNVIQEANGHHVTAQARYLELMGKLKEDGVAFKDIRKFLLNQAINAGLLQKDVWDDKKGVKDYPSKSFLKRQRPAWFVAYLNTCAWISYNYEGYDRRIDNVKKRAEKEAEKTAKKQTVVTRTKDGESRTEIVSNDKDMNTPVIDALSSDQIAQIVLNNLSVFAGEAEAAGAQVEWNALMLKMGKPEEVVAIEVAV